MISQVCGLYFHINRLFSYYYVFHFHVGNCVDLMLMAGIAVGHQFYSRAEMVAVGFHSHWLNGIDFMGLKFQVKVIVQTVSCSQLCHPCLSWVLHEYAGLYKCY